MCKNGFEKKRYNCYSFTIMSCAGRCDHQGQLRYFLWRYDS